MSFSWALVIVFIISYFIGSINFAKILSWQGWRKHITKEGSGNPGTMNMLRTFGLKAALLTLLLEVVKSGLTAWLCAFTLSKCYAGTVFAGYSELVFFFSGIAIVIGSCFPFFGAVKGGKGIACAFGVYVFSRLWYVALALFVIGVIQILITDYGFISSLIFIVLASVCETIVIFVTKVPQATIICVLVWLMCLLILAKHYKNFYRLFTHCENKANFRQACVKMFSKKKSVKAPEQDDGTAQNDQITKDEHSSISQNEEKKEAMIVAGDASAAEEVENNKEESQNEQKEKGEEEKKDEKIKETPKAKNAAKRGQNVKKSDTKKSKSQGGSQKKNSVVSSGKNNAKTKAKGTKTAKSQSKNTIKTSQSKGKNSKTSKQKTKNN